MYLIVAVLLYVGVQDAADAGVHRFPPMSRITGANDSLQE